MTEAPEAPTQGIESLQAKEQASMMASFAEAEAAAAAKPPDNDATATPAQEPTPTKAEPVKATPAPKAELDTEFPEELVSGKPAAVVDPEAEAKADMELITQRPAGQIKHDHFQRVQEAAQRRVDAANAELTKFRADLEKLRSTSGKLPEEHVQEFEKTKAERDAMKAELSRVAFERTPEFKERFTDREKNLRDAAEQTAKESGVDPKIIAQALATSGKHRFEILENAEPPLSNAALSYVSTVLAQHDQLQIEKAAVLSQSRERLTQWEQQRQAQEAQQAEQRKAIETQAFEEALKELSNEHLPYKPLAGNDKWAKEREERIAKARTLYNEGNISEKDLAKTALRAVGSETQDRFIVSLQARLNAANAKIQELTAAGPHVNGSPQVRTPGDESGLTEEQRMMRTFEEAARARGQA